MLSGQPLSDMHGLFGPGIRSTGMHAHCASAKPAHTFGCSGRHAKRPRVHTFLATSDIHMKHKLKMSKQEVIDAAVAAVRHLKSLGCDDIEFSPEDAGRCVACADLDGFCQLLQSDMPFATQ